MESQVHMASAMITSDGHAVHIGTEATQHPIYGTPSFELRASLPLTEGEALLYGELQSQSSGVTRFHIRSALAQLGLDAFHPATVDVRFKDGGLDIITLITSFNGDRGQRVIECMRAMIQQAQKPRIMHAGLFPDATRVSSAALVAALVEQESLIINGSDIYDDGSIGLVPAAPLYTFEDNLCTDDLIHSILVGDGRATLASVRSEESDLPKAMHSKAFLVTGVDVHTRDHHVVLRREVLSGGVHANVVHGESCILQAGRTRGGSRQLELWNANGKAQITESLRIIADLYKTSTVIEPGH